MNYSYNFQAVEDIDHEKSQFVEVVFDHIEDIPENYQASQLYDIFQFQDEPNLKQSSFPMQQEIGQDLESGKNQIQILNQGLFDEHNFEQLFEQQHIIIIQNNQISTKNPLTTQCDTQGMFKNVSRKSNHIRISTQANENINEAKRGHKCQTKQLNINLKTITKKFLKKKKNLKFTDYEHRAINQYLASKPNFEASQKLFGVETEINGELKKTTVNKDCDRLRRMCLKGYSSSKILVDIFKGQKMSLKNKLIFVKYLEAIRNSAIFPESHKQWKQKSIPIDSIH